MTAEEHKQEGLKIFFTTKVTLVSNAGDWKSSEAQSMLSLHPQLLPYGSTSQSALTKPSKFKLFLIAGICRGMKLLVAFIVVRLCM